MKKKLLLGLALGLMSLAHAQNKVLYGLTSLGGSASNGVLFTYEPTSEIYTIKKNFVAIPNGTDPRGSLTQATNGKLYGMTYGGGSNNGGALFEYNVANDEYTIKHNFGGINGGVIGDGLPSGSVIQANNGKLYGMTSKGGGSNLGTLFEYDLATDAYTIKITFNGANGSQPKGDLIQASNGKLYGMTYMSSQATNNDRGVLFEYDPATSVYTKKLDFNGDNGSRPHGNLTEVGGKLYGMTREGGTNSAGVLFEYDLATSVLTKKFDFGGINGRNPTGTLLLASNGKLYGMLPGGTVGDGLIFEYDAATSTYTKKADFDFDNGSNPQGSLMQYSDGKLYGLSSFGGSPELGTMFNYDISTNAITKLVTFDGTNGSTPYYTSLLEVDLGVILATADATKPQVQLYPNPVSDILYLKDIKKANVSVYNMAGQQILNKTITNGQLNLSTLEKGVYMVKVEAEGKISTHKVVKK